MDIMRIEHALGGEYRNNNRCIARAHSSVSKSYNFLSYFMIVLNVRNILSII